MSSISGRIRAYQEHSKSPVDVVAACLTAAETAVPLNAYTAMQEKDAILASAEESATRYLNSTTMGPLDGIPIAVKDNFCTKDLPTSCGSNMLRAFQAPYDATVVRRLRNSGAIFTGKTNMDEFGMGSFNTASAYGPALNPAGLAGKERGDHVSGGSSGGSAVAVAAGTVVAALGSDTGGSVRLPASYCGIVGWKPTYGRCSRYGLVAYASSLDTPGVLATSVADAAIVANVMSGHDVNDSTSLDLPPTTFVPQPGLRLDGLRVGIPHEYHVAEIADDVLSLWRKGVEWMEELGAVVTQVAVPSVPHALPCYYVLAAAEASSNLSRYDGVEYGHRAGSAKDYDGHKSFFSEARGQGFGPEVIRRILAGTFTLTKDYYGQAQCLRRMVCDDFASAFEQVDVLLAPTAASCAPTLREASSFDTVTAYTTDVFTVPASLAGLPAISVPCGLSVKGMPLGLQVMGPVSLLAVLLLRDGAFVA